MPLRHVHLASLLAVVSVIASGCVAAHQRVPLELAADAPKRSPGGRPLNAEERREWAAAMTGRWTVGIRCPEGGCAVSIEPVETYLGAPPQPEAVAARVAPAGLDDPVRREQARRVFFEEVRARYRLWGDHVVERLRDVEVVEIVDLGDRGNVRRHRSGRISEGVQDALGRVADRYASHEWARFEQARATPSRPARRPARRRARPAAVPPPAPAAPEPAQTDAGAGTTRCRQACTLRNRACLARCRNEPVTGGAYDACAYECGADELECEARCDAPPAQ